MALLIPGLLAERRVQTQKHAAAMQQFSFKGASEYPNFAAGSVRFVIRQIHEVHECLQLPHLAQGVCCITAWLDMM